MIAVDGVDDLGHGEFVMDNDLGLGERVEDSTFIYLPSSM